MSSRFSGGWAHQENPEVPGDMTDDEWRHTSLREVFKAPERAGNPGRAGEGEVAGDEVDRAVDGRADSVAGHGVELMGEVAVEEATPEELLARSDQQREGGGDEGMLGRFDN